MEDRFVHFGAVVRRCRQIAGLSQQRLADMSGVSQSVISRLERGKAPRLPLERLLFLQQAMGSVAFPIGYCPHDHNCPWKPMPGRSPLAYQSSTGATGRSLELLLEGQRLTDAYAAGLHPRTEAAPSDGVELLALQAQDATAQGDPD